MKTSVIRQRVADFLQRHTPFDALSAEDLLDLAGSGRVKFHEADEYIFREGDARGQVVWMIQQGRVELLENDGSGEQLRDVLGEGDMVGLAHCGPDGACLHSARTSTDVILYGISAALFESLVPRYPAVKRFIAAHFSVSGILAFGRTSWLDGEAPPADFLRARFVTRKVSGEGLPAVALPLTTRAAIREMLQGGVEELRVTSDGALDSMLAADDLALFCGYNPARLAGEIRQAGSAAELVPLLRLTEKLVLAGLAQPHDVDDCCRIGAYVLASLSDACVRLANRDVAGYGIEGTELPACWLMFGAAARGDRLDLRLPAIAAVYDDSAENFGLDDSVHFAALAGETAAWLHRCGLAGSDWQWPEGSQPSMPLSEWRRFYCETIRNPMGHDLYARREFFDVWPRAGDRAILLALQEEIRSELREHAMTIPLLANDALAHLPPLTFFQGLVVGIDGGSRDSFDIGAAAISPVTDAARVFALAKGRLAPANTLERLQVAVLDFPEGAAILREAAEAFRIALYCRTLAGGSRIDPSTLGKFDQRLLKTAFSSVQHLLEYTAATFIPST
ncbi:MAG: nucleotidyltransferase [Candidatus Solibacter sp.]|nr:nucleotidyltransferase [Candidatus Solibacter sp.]